MDSYEQYEQDCIRIREENKILLYDFEKWLADKGLAPKTIAKHYGKEEIKDDMQEWLDTMDRYDDPEIDDMEKVWGI